MKLFNRVLGRNRLKSLLPKKPRRTLFRSKGEVHDLEAIFARVNEEFFEGKVKLNLTWFGGGKMPKTRVSYGAYDSEKELIKVNRVLDREEVPQSVVAFILYHEALHNLYPPQKGRRGRRNIHHATFRKHERLFPNYSDAEAFLKEYFNSLRINFEFVV